MSGCPFFSSKKPSKNPFPAAPPAISLDPMPFISSRSYPLPYTSPYSILFYKFSLSKNNSLTSLPFHYRNSLFHNTYITKHRKSDFLAKVSMANQLRESGNRNFHKGKHEAAALCYEHAIGLFKYAELQEDGESVIISVQAEDDDTQALKGILLKLLGNYIITLVATKNFREAEELIQEAKNISDWMELRIIEATCKANNSEVGLQDLLGFSEVFEEAGMSHSEYTGLKEKFDQVVWEAQKKNCEFFSEFFAEFGVETGQKLKPRVKKNTGFDLEFSVIEKLDEKYVKMIDYYHESSTLDKVVLERAEVQRVFAEMKYIKSLQASDANEIMQAQAKTNKIDLFLPRNLLKFECAKKCMLSQVFNKGSFNRRLLYQCIQETMCEFELASDASDKLDSEYKFWKSVLYFLVAFATFVYLATAQIF